MTDDELIDEREPIGGLQLLESSRSRSRSPTRFSFPAQDHRIGEDSTIDDPRTGDGAGPVERRRRRGQTITITARARQRRRSRCPGRSSRRRRPQQGAGREPPAHGPLGRRAGLGDGRCDDRRPRAGRGPRPAPAAPPDAGQGPGAPLRQAGETALEAADAHRAGRARRHPADPGPAGIGQDVHGRADDRGARRARASASASSRTATRSSGRCSTRSRSRPAAAGVPVRIGQKPKGGQPPTHAAATVLEDNADVEAPCASRTVDVVGAVAWTWCRAGVGAARARARRPGRRRGRPDEPGQRRSRVRRPRGRIVLLGDPQQLDQPTQGSHPPGAERSALSHLLADPAYSAPTGRRSGPRRACSSTRPGGFTRSLRLHLARLLRRPAPAARRARGPGA